MAKSKSKSAAIAQQVAAQTAAAKKAAAAARAEFHAAEKKLQRLERESAAVPEIEAAVERLAAMLAEFPSLASAAIQGLR